MDPGILVPPKGYGGHERLVAMFAKEYNALGHDVHLLVTAGSCIPGCTIHAIGKEGFPPGKKIMRKALFTAWSFLRTQRNEFDLIHNFGRLAYLLPVLHQSVKKIMTYGREISSRNIRVINIAGGKNLVFTACSNSLLSRVQAKGNWKTVYNAIDFNSYTLVKEVAENAPLIFLGRIEKVKGCHLAIDIARATGNKLIIAGNISPLQDEQEYFKKYIAPHIDGDRVIHVGSVNDVQKNEWLGKAKALIFPIEWNEPFGIVMIEAMACGTPVIAFNIGSVTEVIDEGLTGLKVKDFNEMAAAVNKINEIDRQKCREVAARRFNVSVIAQQYLHTFDDSPKKIVIVTTGQPAANPRVLKEYKALKREGYRVKVLYTYSAKWSFKIDEEKFNAGKLIKNDFVLVGGNPFNKKITYFFSRFSFKLLSIVARVIPLFFFKKISFVRSSFYLWIYAKKHPADIYIAHYLGALPAAISAAAKYKSAVIFDAEDFHRGEEPYYPKQIKDVIEMENRLLQKVNAIITSSPLISNAYQHLYPSKKVVTVRNVFSKKYLQTDKNEEEQKLKLFWFSQNIGPNRGLEVIVDALNTMDEPVTLTLLGNIRNKAYVQNLLLGSKYPDRICFIDPVNPEEIFSIAASFDVGLAAEIPYCENRDICLTNKIFTYLSAGLCIVASDTLAQKDFIYTYPSTGLVYKHDNAAQLAEIIRKLYYDRNFLADCKKNSSAVAASTLNWETESNLLVQSINEI